MEERVHFAVGAASMILAACCLVGALLTAWLRCAARAMTQAAGWAVVQQLDVQEQPQTAGSSWQAGGALYRAALAAEPGSTQGAGGLPDEAAAGAPPGAAAEQPGEESQ